MNFGGGSDFLSSIFLEVFYFNFIFRRRVGQQDGKRKNKESRGEKGGGKAVERGENSRQSNVERKKAL